MSQILKKFIGDNQVGRLANENSFEVKRWSSDEIVAEEIWADDCIKSTLSISIKREVALIDQEPINQSALACRDKDTHLYKWTIEDSPEWMRMKKSLEAN